MSIDSAYSSSTPLFFHFPAHHNRHFLFNSTKKVSRWFHQCKRLHSVKCWDCKAVKTLYVTAYLHYIQSLLIRRMWSVFLYTLLHTAWWLSLNKNANLISFLKLIIFPPTGCNTCVTHTLITFWLKWVSFKYLYSATSWLILSLSFIYGNARISQRLWQHCCCCY